jgi:hypothetical protein
VVLPSWRLQAQPYGYSTDYSLGIYKRLSGRLDVGIQVDGTVTDHESESWSQYALNDSTEATETTQREAEVYDIGVYADVRWWHPVVEHVDTFLGLQIGGSYRESDDRSHSLRYSYTGVPFESDGRTATYRRSISLIPRFGADLELLGRLSLLVAVRPVDVSWWWGEEDRYDEPGQLHQHHSETSNFDVYTSFSAQAFLTLGI